MLLQATSVVHRPKYTAAVQGKGGICRPESIAGHTLGTILNSMLAAPFVLQEIGKLITVVPPNYALHVCGNPAFALLLAHYCRPKLTLMRDRTF